MVRRVIVLGSTGSIGTQTLEVINHLNGLHARGECEDEFKVVGLAAGQNICLLSDQRNEHDVEDAAITVELKTLERGYRVGPGSAEALVREVECDLVVAAMSGAAGIPATLAAIERGRDVALANKETLVAAGEIIIPAAKRSGSRLFPVDSEHSGVWQCLGRRHEGMEARRLGGERQETAAGAPPVDIGGEVSKVVLTASGGPFRRWTREQMAGATVEQALKHPTWSMGRKVTIDSASLMNKALEIIEAHWLFGLPAEKIGAMVHPQSIVHAFVEFVDGSVMAQLGAPDMKTPIQYAMTWPRASGGCSRKLNWAELSKLEFEAVDTQKFPAVDLAYRAIREGGAAGAVLNAANEAAVGAFLDRRIGFTKISELTEQAMDTVRFGQVSSLDDVMRADSEARRCVASMMG